MPITTKYTINELRQACINDYVKHCYSDGGTQADENSLEDYKKQEAEMRFDQLVNESWYIEGDEKFTLDGYIEIFLTQTQYADLRYQTNPDGSTILQSEFPLKTSPHAPTFDHWNLWDRCRFKIENAIRHTYWGTLKRKEQHFRRVYQESIIHKINGYFKTGWQLFGQGPVPWCEFNWSGSWVNTLFVWTDRTDPSNSSYHYRIGCTDHEGEFGVCCHSTDEVFQLGESNGSDEGIFLMIAAASVGLIVDRDSWTSDRIMVIKERIAAAEGLVEIKT